MKETAGKHAAKHARNNTLEIDPSVLRIEFAPHVQQTLNKVIEKLSITADENLLASLDLLASGHADALHAFGLMKDITKALQKHEKATGDVVPSATWDSFASQLYADGKPFILIQKQSERKRG